MMASRFRLLLQPYCVGLLLTLLGWPVTANEAKPTLNQIMAVVGNQVLTSSMVENRLKFLQLRADKSRQKLTIDDNVRQQLALQMVDELILRNFADEAQLLPTPQEFDQLLPGLIRQEGFASLSELRAELASAGIDYGLFKEDVHRQMSASRLRDRDLVPKLTLTEAEIDDNLYLLTQKERANDQVQLNEWFLEIPTQAKSQERQAAIDALQQWRQQLITTPNATQPQLKAIQSRAYGPVPMLELPSLFVQQLMDMKASQLSSVFTSGRGVHLLRLHSRESRRQPPVKQRRISHILIRSNEAQPPEQISQLFEQISQKQLSFAEAARKFSFDNASAVKGGELGWISAGETVPDFEKAAFGQKLKELSPPVRSPYGWHLIVAEDEREVDLSAERRRALVRSNLMQQKIEAAYPAWIRDMRERLYVEIRF